MDIRIQVTTQPPLWQHKEDVEVLGGIRNCALGGCPAVFTLFEPKLKVVLTRDWQYYLIASNYNMDLGNISSILDYRLAFANGTGLTKPSQPRRDYILEKNLTATENGQPAYPKLDKDRTCSRNMLTGRILGTNLLIKTMDGNLPPLLKPGREYPQRIQDINIDDYLYNPREHRWMFVVANTITVVNKGRSSIAPFPRGGSYDWTEDNKTYTFLPLVSRNKIAYPLEYLQKTDRILSPYRIENNQ